MISYQKASGYAESLMTREPALLREVCMATSNELRYDDMLSGPVVGAFLNMLVRLSGAKSVVEIGTFTGYATLWMAMALPPDGRIVTCETNEKYASIARRFFKRFQTEWESPVSGHKGDPPEITLLQGPALDAILPEEVDFIFLDADKEHYPEYFEKMFPLLIPGGIMVIDNAFWGGRVWEDDKKSDRKTSAIDRLNRMIAADRRVENVILTVRDGLHLVRKNK